MSGNSLESLLERMSEGSVTQGWGAVAIFGRSRLNRLLEQQYIERFNGYSFLPPFSGQVFLDELQSRSVELEGIMFGPPRLSFNTSSMSNSSVAVTMNILSGRYATWRHPAGSVKTLLSIFNITEAQGFTLEMDINLSMAVSEIDKQGTVKLDLSKGVNFRCNLAGNDQATNTRLTDFLKVSFENLPAHQSVFQLAMLELKGYRHLTPISFRIFTQVAPGTKVRGALNFGDGAVGIFIRLAGNSSDGYFPPDSNFPYLLPDDQESDGSERYSAALILSEAMIPYIENGRLDVLNNLAFPGDNIFGEVERHTPADLGVFGNINAKPTRISLEPMSKTIQAGDTQRFTLRNGNGDVIQASEWKAVSLQSHTAPGHGTIAGGLYTSAARNVIGHESLHVVVTAKYVTGGTTYTASALLLVVYDSMTVAPQTSVHLAKAQSQPIVLKATAMNATNVTWSLLTPEYGTLTPQGNQATFTPDARSKSTGLVVQQIEVTGAETRRLSLVLVNAQQQLRIDPAYVPAVGKSVDLQLTDDATLLRDLPRRWKVISGGGTVDSTGRFTASAQGPVSSSVVQCDIVSNGVVFSTGYSVIELSELEPEPTWERLAVFAIKVPGGDNQERQGSLYANGYQQLRTEIVVETHPVDGQEYPLSVSEMASMRLVDDGAGDEVEPVDEPHEGIPVGDPEKWRSRLVENRFDLAGPRVATQDNSPSTAISKIDIYLHTRERANNVKTFHAKFQKDNPPRWCNSTEITDGNDTIAITPLAIPQFKQEDYTFKRVRVDGGSGGPYDPGEPDDDDFDFHLRTVDYWKLKYVGDFTLPGTDFLTLEFVSVDPNDGHKSISTSSIRWESEQLAETMFSWTGYIFKDPQKQVPLGKVEFDNALKDVVKNQSLDIEVDQGEIEEGELVISLHRSDQIPYIRRGDQSRDKLSRDLAVKLFDKRGTAHIRRISFLPSSTVGDRNRLRHLLFTPGQ